MDVLVTGGGGRTGSIVVRKLLERGLRPKAMVRCEKNGAQLRSVLGDIAKDAEVVVGDTMRPETMEGHFQGVDTLVITSSSMPQEARASFTTAAMSFFTLGMSAGEPSYWFHEGESPEAVDWHGQRNQIELAKKAGVKHVVLLSSMGGSRSDHLLNARMDSCGSWKRKSECYLITSGLPFTIIHAGGLLPSSESPDVSCQGGRRELFVAWDDAMLDDGEEHNQVTREDLAEVITQCVFEPESQGRSFDLGSGPEEEREIPVDITELLATLEDSNCSYNEDAAHFTGPGRRESMTSLSSSTSSAD